MYDIWYYTGPGTFTKVTAQSLRVAQLVWDALEEAGFYMKSVRPA